LEDVLDALLGPPDAPPQPQDEPPEIPIEQAMLVVAQAVALMLHEEPPVPVLFG
jgi:hypothetical protein